MSADNTKRPWSGCEVCGGEGVHQGNCPQMRLEAAQGELAELRGGYAREVLDLRRDVVVLNKENRGLRDELRDQGDGHEARRKILLQIGASLNADNSIPFDRLPNIARGWVDKCYERRDEVKELKTKNEANHRNLQKVRDAHHSEIEEVRAVYRSEIAQLRQFLDSNMVMLSNKDTPDEKFPANGLEAYEDHRHGNTPYIVPASKDSDGDLLCTLADRVHALDHPDEAVNIRNLAGCVRELAMYLHRTRGEK